jgi:hypothetical protein
VEDAYNYYHSNSRIKIECTFGEIIMRWGIFWRTMQIMGIDTVGNIVSVAGLVHNFIIDERDGESMNYISSFSHANLTLEGDHDVNEMLTATAGGNNEPRPRGRPVINDKWLKQRGTGLRETLTWMLAGAELGGPATKGFKFNQCGMVYME